MGRDSLSICRTCKVYQDNGYGSYTTWMDYYKTVPDFDAEVARLGLTVGKLGRNDNVRAFLVAHEGHDIDWTSGDCWYHDDDRKVLDGLAKVVAPSETPAKEAPGKP